MFIGHYAPGLAFKKVDPQIPLWLLFLAGGWLDFVFFILMLAGVEHLRIVPGITAANSLDLYDYPYSHGLLAAILWSGLTYLLFRFLPLLRTENKTRAALILSVTVFSHWILDFITHIPDLPLACGTSPKVGLGLWNNIPASILVESLIFSGGFYLYLRSTASKSLRGNIGMTIFAIILLILNYITVGGEAPPNTEVMGYFNLAGTSLIIAFAAWLGRNRQ